MNFALAFLAAVLLYVLIGVPHITGPTETQIKTVNQDSPAMAAGLMENDKIILLDYKTDRVKQAQELLMRYQTQLQLYADALSRVFSTDTKKMVAEEKLIYSFHLKEVVTL